MGLFKRQPRPAPVREDDYVLRYSRQEQEAQEIMNEMWKKNYVLEQFEVTASSGISYHMVFKKYYW